MTALDELTRRRLRSEGWPEDSIRAYEVTGRANTLLYGLTKRDESTALPHERRSGRIEYTDRRGKTQRGVLLQVSGNRARVLDDREVRRASLAKPTGRRDYPGEGRAPRTIDVPAERVRPEGR